jgi:hypothetical protein
MRMLALQAILEFIAVRVTDMHALLSGLTPALNRFRDVHSRGTTGSAWDEALRSLAPLGRLIDLSIAIGNALTVRRLLREVRSCFT